MSRRASIFIRVSETGSAKPGGRGEGVNWLIRKYFKHGSRARTFMTKRRLGENGVLLTFLTEVSSRAFSFPPAVCAVLSSSNSVQVDASRSSSFKSRNKRLTLVMLENQNLHY